MARLSLNGDAYIEQSTIANAQETVNLYAELNTKDATAPSPVTYYLTPGLTLFTTPVTAGKVRCTYRTSKGTAFVVVGSSVYFLATNGALVFVGSIPDRTSQVYMADNGLAVVLVDGVSGWAIDMPTNSFGAIIDPSFYGADFVVFLDTFFCFNRPGTNQFYISLSNVDFTLLTTGTSFDPLDIAAKSGNADPIVAILAIHKELWLIGALTTEVWIGTGAADFYFQIVQGAFIEHGCIASYSATNTDVVGFWLMQDKQGKNIVIQGSGYDVADISTPYLVNRFNSYETTADAIGFCFQINNHAFYCLTFPTANETWLYGLDSKKWSKWSWLNADDGSRNRHRANCAMFWNNEVMLGDWETGQIYILDNDNYTDNNVPIIRTKTFMHLVDNLDRIIYPYFDADMKVGTQDPDIDDDPMVSLSWSDNRGITYGFPLEQSMGKSGEFLTTISWNRLGMARDRIFKLEWSAAVKTALNGGFSQPIKAAT